MKVKFSSSEDNNSHSDNDNNNKADNSSEDHTSSSSSSNSSSSFDALIVGGGMMGVCIARDLASSGYQVAIVEREAALGGVWRHNDYPGLRLQGVGTAWRCLSLAPDFHKQTTNANSNSNHDQHNNDDIIPHTSSTNHQHQTNRNTNTKMNVNTEKSLVPLLSDRMDDSLHSDSDSDSRLLYCPLASETLSYIQSMADHPNITIMTNTSYEGLMNVQKKNKRNDDDNDNEIKNGQQQQQHNIRLCSTTLYSNKKNMKTKTKNATTVIGSSGGVVVSAHTVILAVGYTTHNSGKPWLPIDRTAVTNGATIVHSAELSKHNNYQQQLDYWKWLLNLLFTTALTTTTKATTTSQNNNGNQQQQQHQQQQNSAIKSKATTAIVGTTYVVGGQKAAIEVLKSMNPTDNNVVWALRRRDGIFLKKEVLDEVLVATARTNTPVSWFMSRLMRLVPTLIYFGKFQVAESLLLTLGMGVRVGTNDNAKDTDTDTDTVNANNANNNVPAFRGGIVRQEDIEHARKFKQTIITNVSINSKGVVVMKRNTNDDGNGNGNGNGSDESSDDTVVVGPNDRIIFCTGQRTGQSTDEYLNMAVNHSTNGLFVALPYSSQACAAAAYTTKLVLDYLDSNDTVNDNGNENDNGNKSPTTSSNSTNKSSSNKYYSSGKFKASLEKLASHVQQVPVPGSSGTGNSNNEWAKVVVMLSGVGLQFPNQILPSVRGDLALSPHWTSAKVLGKNLDARATLQDLAKPDYGGWYTMATVGVTLLGFRFAKRHFLALSKFKK